MHELLERTARHVLVARQLTLATGAVKLLSAVRGQIMAFDGIKLTTVFGPKHQQKLQYSSLHRSCKSKTQRPKANLQESLTLA